ncbi:MAG: efflux RND transporter permease subunit [Spirochaetes bacterium]|nr:efflux RND transporter permease subunit [Spirochaetota bacterium]
MKRIVEFLMNQKLFIGLVLLLILLSGYVVAKKMNREAFPEVNFDMVSIRTVYPGGSPDDLEQLITVPIEKKLRSVSGIDKVRSYNIESVSVIVVYLQDSLSKSAKKKAVDDIRDAVELVENLPAGAQKPVVEEITTDTMPSIDIAVYGKSDTITYADVREAADDLEEFLYDIEGVAEVEPFGLEHQEFLIEVDPIALQQYRIGMNTVINALRNRNVDLPGGALRIQDTEYILRTKGQYRNAEEIRNTVIMSNDTGYVTRIRDIARVSDTYEEPRVIERFNGKQAVILRVWRQSDSDDIRLVDRIKKELLKFRPSNGAEVILAPFNDMSRFTRESIQRVTTNATLGFILLGLIMFLLMGWRMALLVISCIPAIFMIAIMMMNRLGISFNVISLFAMVMVLGMIVDFGIVVSENTHRYLESGCTKRDAIVRGVTEVFWPVTVTLLCLSAAFSPLLLLSGLMGKFIFGIPVVLTVCLFASWLIAMFVMPALLNFFSKETGTLACNDDQKKEDPYFERGLFGKFQRAYKMFLNWSLRHRYVTIFILIILFVISQIYAKRLGFVFTPPGGEEQITIRTTLPQETNLWANLREIQKIEKIIAELPKSELDNYHSTVGKRVTNALDPVPGEATYKSTIRVNLTSASKRKRSADDIAFELRNKIEQAQRENVIRRDMMVEYFVERKGPPVGMPVNVEIRGKDFSMLHTIAGEYISYLKTIPGVYDIRLDIEEGKKEYRFEVDEVLAARSGISVFDVAQAINASFSGAVATFITRDEERVNLRVRFPESARKKRQSLDEVMVANQRGGLVPLSMVAKAIEKSGFSQINRLNYKRIAQVQANVDLKKVTSMEVNKKLMAKFADIESRYPGYFVSYGGEQEETKKRMEELSTLFLFALLVIYIIIAVFFNSTIVPLVVMAAIPFAQVGVIFALGIHGQNTSFMSTLGFFSLSGVIVSNTLVLVQFIHNMRETGLPLREALVEAGVIRVRPILLTAGTTVLGLFPSIYGWGGEDYMIKPLALSFGYGLIFATVITLLLVPAFYHVAEDIKSIFAKLLESFHIRISPQIYNPSGISEIVHQEFAREMSKPQLPTEEVASEKKWDEEKVKSGKKRKQKR